MLIQRHFRTVEREFEVFYMMLGSNQSCQDTVLVLQKLVSIIVVKCMLACTVFKEFDEVCNEFKHHNDCDSCDTTTSILYGFVKRALKPIIE